MPLYWDTEDTPLYRERDSSDEGNALFERFHERWNKLGTNWCYVLTNWLYDKKVGSYSERSPFNKGGVWDERDAEVAKRDLLGGFSGTEEDWDREIAPMVTKLVGMRVWANR